MWAVIPLVPEGSVHLGARNESIFRQDVYRPSPPPGDRSVFIMDVMRDRTTRLDLEDGNDALLPLLALQQFLGAIRQELDFWIATSCLIDEEKIAR